jgi:hypothetical protein
MHQYYGDILSMHPGEEPPWYDEHAVPRFCEFKPDLVADIYADEVALVLITCQGCGREFHVVHSESPVHRIMAAVHGGPDRKSIEWRIHKRELEYGDPPNIGCCGSGPTMNSEPRRVLEYWRRHSAELTKGGVVTDVLGYMTWNRDRPDLEVDVVSDWVSGPPVSPWPVAR